MLKHRLTIRINDDLFEKIKYQANLTGLSISRYIRQALFKTKPPTHKFDKEVVYKLSEVGSDLNQLVYKINSKECISNENILKIIIEIYNVLNEISKNIGDKTW